MQVPTVGLKPKRKVEEGECSARLQDKRGRIPARCLARAPSRLPRVLPRGQFFRSLDWKRRRSEEHTSELQSLMRISYAVFCLKKNKSRKKNVHNRHKIDIRHINRILIITYNGTIYYDNDPNTE